MADAASLAPVALAGGTGFTGRRVAKLLADAGAPLRALVRAGGDISVLPPTAQVCPGDLSDAAAVDAWLAGCRSLVYVASMGFGHVPGVVAACERAGVQRAVFVSTTAIFTTLSAASKSVRQDAERAVMQSRLQWTIVRPTMIYGAPGDRNVERLLRAVAKWPIVPVPGNGRARVQPVHVDDLAGAIVAAWRTDIAEGRIYELSGAKPHSLEALIDAASAAVGKNAAKLHLPLGPVVTGLLLLEKMGLGLRIKSEQVLRLGEDKAFPHDAAFRDLGYAPRTFEAGAAEEARLLGLVRG